MAEAAVAPRQAGSDADGTLPMRYRIMHLVVVDVLVLAELATAMYFASQNQEKFTLVFLAVFVGLLIPTLYASRLMTRRRLARCPASGSA